ncbi:hypothetical protein M5689_008267 [Euphorbia peplus]|nr:hypothetical protein M5689_008267 [Euphorbia peplus]
MAARSPFGVVKEEIGTIRGGGSTMSSFLTALKTTVQNAEGVTREIEEKKKENLILQEKLRLDAIEKLRLENEIKELKESVRNEAMERFRLEKECKEVKESGVRLREERDGVYVRLKENEVDQKRFIELKRRNCEVECEKLRAETELDVYKTRFKELEGRVCCMEKEVETLRRLGEKNVEAVDMEIEIEKDACDEINAGIV